MLAVAMSFFVQWVSINAATIISYLFKVMGLGCRPGSYVLYGIVGAVPFALLFALSFHSHAAMLQHKALQRREPSEGSTAMTNTSEYSNPDKLLSKLTFSPLLTFLRIWATGIQMAGRFLASNNRPGYAGVSRLRLFQRIHYGGPSRYMAEYY